MCTLTIIPFAALGAKPRTPGYRVVMNRDESPTRPEARPPRERIIDESRSGKQSLRATWPTDPFGGGTWIATNSRGVTLCLLNRNLEPAPILPVGLSSRGEIIPSLIDAEHAEAVIEGARSLELARFAPFRLLACELHATRGASIQPITWDRTSLTIHEPLLTPACFVSSGLGDSRVLPRVRLFEETVADRALRDMPTAQDAFHRHRWPGREAISVLMERGEARTVSITSVCVLHGADAPTYTMAYSPNAPDQGELNGAQHTAHVRVSANRSPTEARRT